MGKVTDETGNRYGRLVVLEQFFDAKGSLAQWICQCDCGNDTVVSGRNLRNGNTKSCGCLQKERASEIHTVDMTGQRYGRLTVIKRRDSDKHGNVTWLCKCDCGEEVVVRGSNLRRGSPRSCGCLQKESVSLPSGVAAFNAVVRKMRYGAEQRGYDWQLTDEQVRQLTKQPCYYCGGAPSQVHNDKNLNGVYVYNGLDRVDNGRGYTVCNVVSCCGTCNRNKWDKSIEQFRDWIVAAYQHFASAEAFATRK